MLIIEKRGCEKMSVSVIGMGTISFEVPFDSEFIESIVEKMKGMVSFNDVRQFEETVYFDMSGNNGIDYMQLDEIKDELLKEKDLRFTIYVNEYSECEGGYSFDSKGD